MHGNTAEFASAIRNRNRQHALVVFHSSHVYLTDEDIDASGGIQFIEMFNSDTEMTMGKALASEVSLSLINRGEMSGIDFTDEFTVYLGVERGRTLRYGDVSGVASGATMGLVAGIESGSPAVISTNPGWTRLSCNGVSYTLSSAPQALVCEEDTLYVIGAEGTLANTFTVTDGTLTPRGNVEAGAFMLKKMEAWAKEHACITFDLGILRRFDLSTLGGSPGGASKLTWGDLSETTWGDLSETTWGETIGGSGSISYTETLYVPLGFFDGERPDKVLGQTINLLGYDRMVRFDVDATEFLQSLSFPMTLRSMFEAVCAWCGVPYSYANGRTFINENKVFTTAPQRASGSMTCRDVLRWIAEASCAYARMTRTGECELAWFSETEYECLRTDRFNLNLAEYEVPTPDKLCVHVTENDMGVILPQTDTFTGNGSTRTFYLTDACVHAPTVMINSQPAYAFTFNSSARSITFNTPPTRGSAIVVMPGETNTNVYNIVDNPYLYGMTDAEVRAYARNIYEHLITATPVHSPASLEAECNWAVQTGDIISVEDDDGEMRRMPIYVQTITWNGHAEVTYESTGFRRRGTMSTSNRERLASGYSRYEITKTIEGLTSEVYTYDPETGERVSRVEQLAGEMDAMVRNDEIIARINLSREGVKIAGEKLTFEGLVTANENFKILMDGSMQAKNGKFSGTVESGHWTFNDEGSVYKDGELGISMRMLTGSDFVGGGSGGYRAFYGSDGCDVQYGSDYEYGTFIRGRYIKIISQVDTASDFRSAEFKKISGANDMTFVCGESTGIGGESGNLGCEDQPWDTLWVRKQHRGDTDSSYSSRTIKRDITQMGDMGDIIDALTPVRFRYKWEPDERYPHHGLIFEDTVDVYPDICDIPEQGEDVGKYAGIMYEELIAVFLKEIQTLRRRVRALENGG